MIEILNEVFFAISDLDKNNKYNDLRERLKVVVDYPRKIELAKITTDFDEQLALANDADDRVRGALAAHNEKLDEKIQLILANDASVFVRNGLADIADAPNSRPLKIQKILVKDKNYNVRAWLAVGTNQFEIQKILAKDKEQQVRFNLTENESLFDDVQMLLIDEFPKLKRLGPKTKAYVKMKKVLDK